MIDEAALATCKAKYPDPTPPTETEQTESTDGKKKSRRHGRRGNSCLMECYLNQTSVYKNGALDKGTAVTVLGQSLDASLQKTLATALDSCVAMQESFKGKFQNGGRKPSGDKKKGDKNGEKKRPMPQCNHEAGFLVRCIEMELYKNCPAGKKVSSEDCTGLTTYMDKCKFEKKH